MFFQRKVIFTLVGCKNWKVWPNSLWQSVLFVTFASCLHLQAPLVDFEWITLESYTPGLPGVSSSLDCRANRCFSTNSLLVWKNGLPGGRSNGADVCDFLLRMSFVGRRIWTKPFGSPWMLWSFRFFCVPCLHL